MAYRPIIGISVGDPTGIGPEVVAKALALEEVYNICRPLAVADVKVMEQACQIAKVDCKVHSVSEVSQAFFTRGIIDVLDLPNVEMDKLVHGKVSEMGGRASFEYIKKVIELALKGEINATVTGPIHKEAINLAGYHFSGHTEIYADLTKTKNYAMMLAEGSFRVVHVTTHVSLREACDLIKKERILEVIKLAHNAMVELGIENPRIAVPGLNPHAGEGGLFGREELEEIIPAIEEAKKLGYNVEGPVPPDTVFVKLQGGQYDVSLAMYHDQGHIPTKILGFRFDEKTKRYTSVSGVNITLGLPIIRVSVDHGVAFGKAGKGTANPESMIEAIKLAAKFASARKGK